MIVCHLPPSPPLPSPPSLPTPPLPRSQPPPSLSPTRRLVSPPAQDGLAVSAAADAKPPARLALATAILNISVFAALPAAAEVGRCTLNSTDPPPPRLIG